MKYLIALVALSLCFVGEAQVSFTNNSMLLVNSEVASSHSIGVADMNNDGKDDVIRMNDGVELLIDLQEEPNEEFNEVAIGLIDSTPDAWSWGLAIGDANNDGYNDIVTGGAWDGVKFLINEGGSSFEIAEAVNSDIFVQGINFFDINNDGLNDIFSCDDVALSKVYINVGDGQFVLSASYLQAETDEESDNSGNYGSCFVDVDNNGHCDLYIAKCRQGVNEPTDPRRINLLYLNDGDGNWTSGGADANLANGYQSWSADFGDYDNDGDMDVVMAHHDFACQFYENDGTGVFTEVTEEAGLTEAYTFTPYQSSMQDFNNDGWIDILITGGDNNSFCMNNGDGTFTVHEQLLDYESNSYAIGDLNSDGYLDLLVTPHGYGGGGSLNDAIFFNDGGDNNFLRVQLEGVESNSNGIGSRIEVNSASMNQIRDVKSGESYGISHTLIQHFGLGDDAEVNDVTVHWPNGVVEIFGGFDASQQVTLVQGAGSVLSLHDFYNAGVQLEVYPNPSESEVTFLLNGAEKLEGRLTVEVSDLSGRSIDVLSLNDISVTLERNETMSSGSYVYTLKSDGVPVYTGQFLLK